MTQVLVQRLVRVINLAWSQNKNAAKIDMSRLPTMPYYNFKDLY